jgi:CDGSH-type Zn-finger protein
MADASLCRPVSILLCELREVVDRGRIKVFLCRARTNTYERFCDGSWERRPNAARGWRTYAPTQH